MYCATSKFRKNSTQTACPRGPQLGPTWACPACQAWAHVGLPSGHPPGGATLPISEPTLANSYPCGAHEGPCMAIHGHALAKPWPCMGLPGWASPPRAMLGHAGQAQLGPSWASPSLAHDICTDTNPWLVQYFVLYKCGMGGGAWGTGRSLV